jgi:hypothetical protein
MLIQVNYGDDRYDYVKDFMLDTLLAAGAIAQFRRSSGWVQVGVDSVRKGEQGTLYRGTERRSAHA